MDKCYFGEYLVSQGIITPEQLIDVLDYQESIRLKLDVLAINAGFMTPEQVYVVHTWQMKIDKMFGEISVEKGFLTTQQLEELIATQQKNNLLLGQALVERKHLSPLQLKQAIEQYKKDACFSDEQFSAVQCGDTAKIIKNVLNFGNDPLNEIYVEYVALMLRNLTRFIDNHPKIVSNALLVEVSAPFFVTQEITGAETIFSGIFADEDVLLQIASKMEGENLRVFDDYARNAVQEFLDLHNCIFISNTLDENIKLEAQPPKIFDEVAQRYSQGWVITFLLGSGELQLVLSDTSLL